MTESKVLTATVCWFDSRKGYGYLTKDNGTGDIFVHWSNILMDNFKTLKPGQVVSYEIGANHKGEQAVNIKVIKDVPKKEDRDED